MSEVVSVHIGDLSSLGEGELHTCRAGQFDVLICRANKRLYAIEDSCSHAETTLSDGLLDGFIITCPLHGAQFDVRDGTHKCAPAYRGVASFSVIEDASGVTVEVPSAKTIEVDYEGGGGMFRTR